MLYPVGIPVLYRRSSLAIYNLSVWRYFYLGIHVVFCVWGNFKLFDLALNRSFSRILNLVSVDTRNSRKDRFCMEKLEWMMLYIGGFHLCNVTWRLSQYPLKIGTASSAASARSPIADIVIWNRATCCIVFSPMKIM